MEILWLQLPGMFLKLLSRLHWSRDALLLTMQEKFCQRETYRTYFILSKVAAVGELLFPHCTLGCAQGGVLYELV